MNKSIIAVFLVLLFAGSAHAADLGCGRDTDLSGAVDNYCPGDDADNDGFTVAEGDCDDNDFDIYPGAYWSGSKVGCSAGYWRTCKADGTGYTACSNATWCPNTSDTAVVNGAPASQCIYVDNAGNDTTGDGSYGNPYKTLDKIAALTNGGTNLTQGTAVVFKGTGTITGTVTPYTDSTVENEPGSATSRFILAGYPSTSFTTMPKVGWQVQTGGTAYIVYSQFEITYTAAVGVNGGVYIQNSPHSITQGMYVHDVERPTQDNISCVAIEDNGLDHIIRNNHLNDCYGLGASASHGAAIRIFNPKQSSILYNDIYAVNSTKKPAAGIEFKHGDTVGENIIKGNYIGGTVVADYAIQTQGDIGNQVTYNLFTNVSVCINVDNDLDDSIRYGGGSIYRYNTCAATGTPVVFKPDKRWNAVGTESADRCSGTITWGAVAVDHNIFTSSASTFVAQEFDKYGPELNIMSAWLAIYASNYNGYWGTGVDTNPDFSLWNANNADNTCAGQGSSGTTYSGFAAIQTAGFEANGVNEDPSFDSSYIAANTNLAGFGYMQPAAGGGGGETPTVVGGRAPFRRW